MSETMSYFARIEIRSLDMKYCFYGIDATKQTDMVFEFEKINSTNYEDLKNYLHDKLTETGMVQCEEDMLEIITLTPLGENNV